MSLSFAETRRLVRCNPSGSSFSKQDLVPKVLVPEQEVQRSQCQAHRHGQHKVGRSCVEVRFAQEGLPEASTACLSTPVVES